MGVAERRQRAGREAIEWAQALRRGKMAPAEREQFVDWLRESPIHVAELLRITHVQGLLEQFQGWERGAMTHDAAKILEPKSSGHSNAIGTGERARWQQRKGAWIGTLAASIVTIAFALGWSMLHREESIETLRGEPRREVVLSDKSVVVLAPESRLRVRMQAETREVFLDEGQAVFRVAKNANRPFLVRADGAVARAVGTTFGVEDRGRGVIVTVAEGKVEVSLAALASPERRSSASSDSQSALSADAAGGSILLVAGQQVTVGHTGLSAVHGVDTERTLSWVTGRLVFAEDPVVAVIEQFNRYNRVQIRVADEALGRRPVTGTFNVSDPEAFVAFMQSVASIRVQRDSGNSITIASAPE